jgi:hypothetical protein
VIAALQLILVGDQAELRTLQCSASTIRRSDGESTCRSVTR